MDCHKISDLKAGPLFSELVLRKRNVGLKIFIVYV